MKLCSKCGEAKPVTEFYKRSACCKVCELARQREHYAANSEAVLERKRLRYDPEIERERHRRYRDANHEAVIENSRRRFEADRERQNEARSRRYWANPEGERERRRNQRDTTRAEVLARYSPSSPPRCACCATTDDLVIDHIGGGGRAHRKELNITSGSRFHRWLLAENFPPGYQVLCRACNTSKGDGEHCRRAHDSGPMLIAA